MTRLLEAKTALITGAASGIGAATARLFAREGARLLLTDCNAAAGEALADALRGAGGDAVFQAADVADEHQVAALLETARHRFGRLDCAFNNAGVNGRAALLEDMDLAEWQRTLAVNLSGVFLCLKHELRLMQTQGHGAIVNNASGGGLIAVPQMAAYCASKHGVLGLTKTAAQENARRGIRVNAVLPGSTDTPMLRAAMGGSADAERMILASVPGGRLGRPEEVAEAVAWLCSDRASYVSGESLLVDMATVAR
ncbi:short chain dehydrogenase [Denitratisoma sp. DHT3]|uniref:SDR family NAD(P)-dependent oxidoreductase n=1 Tax=Denitratisoma sp. DHT3 TaxID=1981880 RepID=UPI0011985546|nr:glucose 1-dehydrogenase [Denitratisoma sp. DHT3]QDX82369.1 short chain dehydrogenase [Denitratisoma sp. DHT3]